MAERSATAAFQRLQLLIVGILTLAAAAMLVMPPHDGASTTELYVIRGLKAATVIMWLLLMNEVRKQYA